MSDHLSLWPVERISHSLPVTPKKAVIEALLDLALQGMRLIAERRARLLEALLQREKQGSTAAGGLAIPHVKSPELRAPVGALGVFPAGTDFAAVDGEKVHAVFLLLSPASMAEEHLAALRFIASVARNPDFLRFVKRTRSPQDARALLEEMGSAG